MIEIGNIEGELGMGRKWGSANGILHLMVHYTIEDPLYDTICPL